MTSQAVADQLELFCIEYLKDFKGAAAARRAGVSAASARSYACRALADPAIAARIEQVAAERRQRAMVESDDVVRALRDIAFTDLNELVELRRCCCRHCWGQGFGYQRTDGAFRAAQMRHALEVKRAQESGADLVDGMPGFDLQGGPGFDASRDPHPECPECSGEGVVVPFLKDTRDLSEAARAAYAGLKVTKEGIELKAHDRMRALEMLGRHLGIFNDKLDVNLTHKLADRMRNRVPLA